VTPLAWLFVLAGLVSLDVRMRPAILPAIAASLGATAGQADLSMTAYAVAYGLMQVVYGPLSDRYGRIRLIRATALPFAIGTLSSGLAADLWGFVGARLLTGVFAAGTIRPFGRQRADHPRDGDLRLGPRRRRSIRRSRETGGTRRGRSVVDGAPRRRCRGAAERPGS
jgi:MFS transporter